MEPVTPTVLGAVVILALAVAKLAEKLLEAFLNKKNGNGKTLALTQIEHDMLRSLSEWKDRRENEDRLFQKEMLDRLGIMSQYQRETCSILERLATRLEDGNK